MTLLDKLAADRTDNGVSLLALYRTDKWLLRCRKCRLQHLFHPADDLHRGHMYADWCEKHPYARGCLPIIYGPDEVMRIARREERRRKRLGLGTLHYAHNSDVKEAFGTETALTVTNLHSLASSATAGWGSGSVDNSSNLYLDALVAVHIAAVNTAPGNNKAAYHYAYGSTDGAIWTSTGTSGGTVGTEGTLTFPSISTPLPVIMPLIGVTGYPVQNKAIDSGPYGVAKGFSGILPKSWGIAELNFTGFTYAASGNTRKYHPVYNTVI